MGELLGCVLAIGPCKSEVRDILDYGARMFRTIPEETIVIVTLFRCTVPEELIALAESLKFILYDWPSYMIDPTKIDCSLLGPWFDDADDFKKLAAHGFTFMFHSYHDLC